MMGKNNYQDWTKEDLIQEIKRLKAWRYVALPAGGCLNPKFVMVETIDRFLLFILDLIWD